MSFNFPVTKNQIEDYVNLGWVVVANGQTEDGKFKRPLREWKKYNAEEEIKKPSAEDIWHDIISTFRGKATGIGAITGIHSGFVVIDLDSYKDTANYKNIEGLLLSLNTPIAKSGGGGYHIYIKYTEELKTNVNAVAGIDIRGQGGYIVLPPSLHHSGGNYEWIKSPFEHELIELPDFILDALPKRAYKSAEIAGEGSYQLFNYKRLYGVGERDSAMFSMARSLIRMLPKHRLADAGYSLYEAWCKTHIEDPTGEMTTERFLKEKFVHASTYDDLKKTLPSSVTDLINNPDVFDSLFNQDRFGIPTGFKRLDEKSGGILINSLTLIVAQTGIGKSIVFLNFLENISKTKKVAYLDLENGINETLERLIRIKRGLTKQQFTDPRNKENILRLAKTEFDNYFYVSSNEKIRDRKVLYKKMEELADKGVEVFAVDPLQIIDGGEDLKISGEIVKDLSDFSKKYNVAVLLCHHLRKTMNAGGKYVKSVDEIKEYEFLDPQIEDIKGGSIIPDTAENIWALTRNFTSEDPIEKSKVILKILKCRNNADAQKKYGLFFDHQTLKVYEDIHQLSFYHQAGSLYNA